MSKKHFTVVARAESGAYFPPDSSFTINATQTEFGALVITYRTRRVQLKDFDKPVSKGLFVEVSGAVDSPRCQDSCRVI